MTTRPTATYRSLFAAGEFRVLLAGVVLFGAGFQMEILALSVLVYARTSSPLLSAVTFGIGFLPQLLGGALLTSLADRLPARRALVIGLLVRAAPGLAIGLAPALPVWVMLVVVAAAALFAPLVTGASSGLLPDVVPGEHYVLARSVFGLAGSSTQLLGLAIGGAVLTVIPSQHLLLLSGGVLVLAALLTRAGLGDHAPREMSPPAGPGPSAGPTQSRTRSRWVRGTVQATLRGNLDLLADPTLRGLLLATWLPASLCTGAESLIVPYVGSLGDSASTASVLLAGLPTGMLVGDAIVGRLLDEGQRRRAALPLALLTGLPLLGFLFTPPLGVALPLLVVSGVGAGYALGLQQPFLDAVPVARRGLAFGLRGTGLMGGQGLTPPLVGAVAAATGVGAAMGLAGAVVLATVVALRSTLRPAAPTPAR